MRFITFKTLEGKNFLSFGDSVVKVNLKSGVNAIIGTNYDKEDSKNGAGKSSITELLYYSLYGVTLREISKDHIQNSLTKGKCEVSLEFDVLSNNSTDEYKIVRKLNPTKCQLFKNGEDVTRSTLAKTNALIQDIIHTPSTVFQNSVIMAVNNALPFMALPKTDKRKFIESVLGLEVFTDMVLKARDDYSIAKKDYELAYAKLEQQQSELSFNQTQLDNYQISRQERLKKLEDRKITLEKDLNTLQVKLTTTQTKDLSCSNQQLESHKQKLQQLQDKIRQLDKGIFQAQAEINAEKKQIDKLQTNKDICPTCNREYSEEHTQHVTNSITNHQQAIDKYSDTIAKLNEASEKVTVEISSLKTTIKNEEAKKQMFEEQIAADSNIQTSLGFLNKSLKETNDEIEITNNEQNNELKGKVSTLRDQVNENITRVDKLNNDLNVLETVKFVISEEGIKSFIVKKILKVLNSRVAYYLKKLEANCLCQFNEFFDEEIVDENANPKSYFNFSGGERKRIDLSCLFAFADIRRLQGDVNFSTVFYDELLDSSLDDKGVQLTLKILRERFNDNNESCYIITHRGPEVLCKAEHVIHVIKQNGITRVNDT
jgi:DNA repair exonuclease SbcCD ATPase subunit